jgi:DNA-directed RNA polymerase subunit RPC12/RpoP
MDQVPPLPKDFEDWLKNKAFENSKYIFYKRIRKMIHGVCSHCGSRVMLENATHNKLGRCPECRAKVTFKAINKAKRYADWEIVSIIQKIKDGYVIRYFKGIMTFKNYGETDNFPNEILDTLKDPKFYYYEGSREIITFGKQDQTKWEEFERIYSWQIKGYEWKKEMKRSSFNNKELLRDSNPYFYKRNLKRLLKRSKWKYCGLDHYKGTHMNISNYLYVYEQKPALEYLCKLGLKRIVVEVVNRMVYWGNSIVQLEEKRLGLDKESFVRAIKLDMGQREMEFQSFLSETKYKVSDQQFKWAVANTDTETFSQMLKYTTAHKIIKYIETQAVKGDTRHSITTWRDYMYQCNSLGMDVKNDFVIFPRNLIEKHDEYTQMIKENENKVLDEGIIRQHKKWSNKLNYQAGNLGIELAAGQKQLLDEGAALRHCVGSYGFRMAEGRSLILFIRKNQEPYYTVELDVDKLEVKQCRGQRNKAPEKDVKHFLNKWKVKRLLAARNEIKIQQRVI